MKSLKEVLNESRVRYDYIEIMDVIKNSLYKFKNSQVELLKEPWIDNEYDIDGVTSPLRYTFKSGIWIQSPDFKKIYDTVGVWYIIYFLYDYHNNKSRLEFVPSTTHYVFYEYSGMINAIGYDKMSEEITNNILNSKEWKNMNMPNTFPKSFEKQFKDIKKYWEKNMKKELIKDFEEQFK